MASIEHYRARWASAVSDDQTVKRDADDRTMGSKRGCEKSIVASAVQRPTPVAVQIAPDLSEPKVRKVFQA
ncbi:hypothetical protein ACEPAH_8234 [Sanghuangporus vaninii]